jgi:hypothetical protein
VSDLRRPHVHHILVVFEQDVCDRRTTRIGVSENEYAKVAHGLAVRRRLAKCGRQSERWDDEPLSRLAVMLYVSMGMRRTRGRGREKE